MSIIGHERPAAARVDFGQVPVCKTITWRSARFAQPTRGFRSNRAAETKQTMIQVRLALLHSLQGLRWGGKCSMRLYTGEHLQWVRVIDWANGLPIPDLQDLLAKPAKRSAE